MKILFQVQRVGRNEKGPASSSSPVVASFVAGGVAGAVSRTVMSPLERLYDPVSVRRNSWRSLAYRCIPAGAPEDHLPSAECKTERIQDVGFQGIGEDVAGRGQEEVSWLGMEPIACALLVLETHTHARFKPVLM
jgi:hypothetical protein